MTDESIANLVNDTLALSADQETAVAATTLCWTALKAEPRPHKENTMIINDIVGLAKISLYVDEDGENVVGFGIDADEFGAYDFTTGGFRVANPTLRRVVVRITNVFCDIHARYMKVYWCIAHWRANRKNPFPYY